MCWNPKKDVACGAIFFVEYLHVNCTYKMYHSAVFGSNAQSASWTYQSTETDMLLNIVSSALFCLSKPFIFSRISSSPSTISTSFTEKSANLSQYISARWGLSSTDSLSPRLFVNFLSSLASSSCSTSCSRCSLVRSTSLKND